MHTYTHADLTLTLALALTLTMQGHKLRPVDAMSRMVRRRKPLQLTRTLTLALALTLTKVRRGKALQLGREMVTAMKENEP